MQDENVRETYIYHGTTLPVAELIVAQKKFDQRQTFFSATRQLAQEFAARTCNKQRHEQSPALVKVALYESDLEDWRKCRLVSRKPFSEGDQAQFRGLTQLVFTAEGMRLLNTHMFTDELAVETIGVK